MMASLFTTLSFPVSVMAKCKTTVELHITFGFSLSIEQVVCRKDNQVKSKKENIQKKVSVYRSSVYILIFFVYLKFKHHMGETGSHSDTGSLSASHNL